jgi:hypothetical protein
MIFAKIIGVEKGDYKSKSDFVYLIYQEFFKHGKNPDNIDVGEIIFNFKNREHQNRLLI